MFSRIEDGEIIIKSEGFGDVALLLGVFLTAKFKGDSEYEHLLSPPLNDLISKCLEVVSIRGEDVVSYYEKWVEFHHKAEVLSRLNSLSMFNNAEVEDAKRMMETALYPGRF